MSVPNIIRFITPQQLLLIAGIEICCMVIEQINIRVNSKMSTELN